MSNSQKHYQFVQNKECEYFPCHSGVPKEEFNCLFCYCPLYFFNKACGGKCEFLDCGIKDCTNCNMPHKKGGYDLITAKLTKLMTK